MWTYSQATGHLTHDGELVATGYSGHGSGLDNHAEQEVKNVGPIPIGTWEIGPAEHHPHLGPLAMPLTPLAGTETYDRSGFFVHGDNALLNHTASEGCIILGRDARELLAQSEDRTLEVVE